MSASWTRRLRLARWVLLLPWVCTMDDGCAAIEALHEGRAVASRPPRTQSPAPVQARGGVRPS